MSHKDREILRLNLRALGVLAATASWIALCALLVGHLAVTGLNTIQVCGSIG